MTLSWTTKVKRLSCRRLGHDWKQVAVTFAPWSGPSKPWERIYRCERCNKTKREEVQR